MTVFNNSFEIPTGTQPVLTSQSSEPFTLTDATFLDVRITARGGNSGVYRWEVSAADFADITAASAVEVRGSINAQALGFTASLDGTKVVLTSAFAASTMEIVGGDPQTVLQWPSSPATGESLFGAGQGWVVTSTTAGLEWGGFSTVPESPFESFETGWEIVVLADLAYIFGINEDFETDWDVITTGAAQTAGITEDFESGWDVVVVLPNFTLTVGLVSEDFESGWDVTGAVAPAVFVPGVFADGNDFESFENQNPTTHIVTIVNALAGLYTIEIDGQVYSYTSPGLETTADIATGLLIEILANTQFTGANIGSELYLRPQEPVPGIDSNLQVEGPSGGAINVQLATDFPSLDDQWVGQDLNRTF